MHADATEGERRLQNDIRELFKLTDSNLVKAVSSIVVTAIRVPHTRA